MTEKKITFAMSGRRRPKRSASRPKISAPTGRMSNVQESVATIFALETWKSAARESKRKTTTKKSNASRVQPRKLAATALKEPRRAEFGVPDMKEAAIVCWTARGVSNEKSWGRRDVAARLKLSRGPQKSRSLTSFGMTGSCFAYGRTLGSVLKLDVGARSLTLGRA